MNRKARYYWVWKLFVTKHYFFALINMRLHQRSLFSNCHRLLFG